MNKGKIIKELTEEIEELKETYKEAENGENKFIKKYDEYLDDEGAIYIGSLRFNRSEIIKNLDEIAYNCGYNDFIDETLNQLTEDIKEKKEKIKELKEEIKELKEEC